MSAPVIVALFPTPLPSQLSPQAESRPELKSQFVPSTLMSVVSALEANRDLDAVRKKALAAAVRASARLLKESLDAVSAAPKHLLPRLAALSPVAVGRSAKTIANIKSLVKQALIVTRAGRRVGFDGSPLSPAWRALYGALPTKRLRNALSRFIYYANQLQVAPDQVTSAFLARFATDLEATGEVANVHLRHRETAVFWNQCSRTIAGWPQSVLPEPRIERARRNLAWSDFPATFCATVDAYCEWLSGLDVFADDGPARPCKPTTIRQRREMLRIAASNLVGSGFPINELTHLSVLVATENAKAMLRRLYEQNDRKPTAFLRAVASELVAIVAHYPRVSDQDLEALKKLRRMLGPLPNRMTTKNRTLLQRFEDERLLARLLELPALLAREARRSRLSAPRRLQTMQIALAIELLLCAPIRLGNLCRLELGRHLPDTFTQNSDVHISLLEDEVKNGRPMLLPLSRSAKILLNEYLRDFRPLAAVQDEMSLFVAAAGKPKSAESIRDGITKAIKRRVGIHMSPHQFRHLAGALILRETPGAYPLVKQLLGHVSLKTTLAFYAADQSRAAGRVLDQIVAARRRHGGV